MEYARNKFPDQKELIIDLAKIAVSQGKENRVVSQQIRAVIDEFVANGELLKNISKSRLEQLIKNKL